MTITQADRDAVNAFHSASFTALFSGGGDKQTVGGNMNKAHTLLLEAFAAHREAAEARARLEGAKAMQSAAMDHIRGRHVGNGTEFAQRIAALDPAQITGANHDR